MSEPKPLRFARVEDEEQVPDWVKASQAKAGSQVRPLELSQVLVDSIADAAEGSGRPTPPRRPPPRNAANFPDQGTAGGAGGPSRSLPPGPGAGGRKVPQRAPEPKIDPALEAQLREATTHFAHAAADLATARQEALGQAEGQLLDLSIRIAEVIIEREVSAEPELHKALVDAALQCLAGERDVTLQVSEAAHAVLHEVHGGTQFESNGITVKLAKKASLTGLGCIVETGHVRVDGRLTQRLNAVRRAFEDERRRLSEGSGEAES